MGAVLICAMAFGGGVNLRNGRVLLEPPFVGAASLRSHRSGRVGSVSPSFSAPPLSLPKLSFPVNWGPDG